MIYFDYNFTMRFPNADPHEVRKAQGSLLLPLVNKILGKQGIDTWYMAGGECKISFDIAHAFDVERLASHLAQIDLSCVRHSAPTYSYLITHVVPSNELLKRAEALTYSQVRGRIFGGTTFDAQDEALQELRDQAASYAEVEISPDTRTINLDMQIECSFPSDTDMFKFKTAFC